MQKYSTIRWGIIGTGWIAEAFGRDVQRLGDHCVAAVGSRTLDKARAFATRIAGTGPVPRAYGSYEALVADVDVDVVYVATPHTFHHDNTLLALHAGKPVLVEKPFAMNATEAAAMVALARARNLFIMEAMWTRFLPHMVAVRRILADGLLGRLVSLSADHGQYFAPDPRHRLYALDLGGGALLDLGIYPVSFASMVFGSPTRILAASDPAFTGADAQTSMIFGYDRPGEAPAQALLTTTLRAVTPTTAVIVGEEARLEIARPFYVPSTFTVTHRDGRILERYTEPYQGHGLQEEAAEVGRCLRAGATESTIMSLDETVAIMRTLDRVRELAGAR